jgi:hypothetical protein
MPVHLSDNGLRKICKKMKVPTPYAGYWAILQNGKKAKVTQLPAPDSKTVMEYTFYLERARIPMKIKMDLPEIKVTENLRNPHPLIANALQYKKDKNSIDPKLVIPLGFSKNLERRGLLILNTIFYELEKRNCVLTCEPDRTYGELPSASRDGVSVRFHLYEQTKAHKIEKLYSWARNGNILILDFYSLRSKVIIGRMSERLLVRVLKGKWKIYSQLL